MCIEATLCHLSAGGRAAKLSTSTMYISGWIIRAPALQAVRLVWVPRTSRSATPKRPFVGNKNDVAFSVPDPVGSGALHRSLFRRSDQDAAHPSLAGDQLKRQQQKLPHSTRIAATRRRNRISEKRADAVLAHQQRGSRKRSSASAAPHVKRPLLLRAKLE